MRSKLHMGTGMGVGSQGTGMGVGMGMGTHYNATKGLARQASRTPTLNPTKPGRQAGSPYRMVSKSVLSASAWNMRPRSSPPAEATGGAAGVRHQLHALLGFPHT